MATGMLIASLEDAIRDRADRAAKVRAAYLALANPASPYGQEMFALAQAHTLAGDVYRAALAKAKAGK